MISTDTPRSLPPGQQSDAEVSPQPSEARFRAPIRVVIGDFRGRGGASCSTPLVVFPRWPPGERRRENLV